MESGNKLLPLGAVCCLLLAGLLQVSGGGSQKRGAELAKSLELVPDANTSLIKDFQQTVAHLEDLMPLLANEQIEESSRLIVLMPLKRLFKCLRILLKGEWRAIPAAEFPYGCCVLSPLSIAIPTCRFKNNPPTAKPKPKGSTSAKPLSTSKKPAKSTPAPASKTTSTTAKAASSSKPAGTSLKPATTPAGLSSTSKRPPASTERPTERSRSGAGHRKKPHGAGHPRRPSGEGRSSLTSGASRHKSSTSSPEADHEHERATSPSASDESGALADFGSFFEPDAGDSDTTSPPDSR